jgi:hypothetical protein
MQSQLDPQDICVCGDYRSDHDDKGVCKLNGLGHTTPNYKCEKFVNSNQIEVASRINLRDRAAQVALNFAGQTISSYDGTYTLLIDCIYDALLEVVSLKGKVDVNFFVAEKK